MPGDLAVNAASTLPSRPSAAASGASEASSPRSGGGVAASAGGAPASLYANPVSQLDPALGIVVLHFYNQEGNQTASIPTQKQLDSYRLHGDASARTGPEPAAPANATTPATTTAPDATGPDALGRDAAASGAAGGATAVTPAAAPTVG